MTIEQAIADAKAHGSDEGAFRIPFEVGLLSLRKFQRLTSYEVTRLYGLGVSVTYLSGFFVVRYLVVIKGQGKHIAEYLTAFEVFD